MANHRQPVVDKIELSMAAERGGDRKQLQLAKVPVACVFIRISRREHFSDGLNPTELMALRGGKNGGAGWLRGGYSLRNAHGELKYRGGQLWLSIAWIMRKDFRAMLNLFQVVVLAVIQGLAELLPVSSSAHVIVAAKLMGLDPSRPEMTLLLVMLHCGTMFAVIVYFWKAWRQTFFSSSAAFRRIALLLGFSTLLTALVGYPIKWGIEKIVLRHIRNAEIEMIFGNLGLVAVALAAVGCLIIYSGLRTGAASAPNQSVGWREAVWMGAVQGLCLPFRGFSRSGATISTGLILGATKSRLEEYSFALAVILTPPVVAREVKRMLESRHEVVAAANGMAQLFGFSLLGLILSFLAGLVALKWLSGWLEHGRWYIFGVYCLAASIGVFALYQLGF